MCIRDSPTGVIDAINKQWTDYTGISTEEAHRGEWMRAYPGVDGQTALNQYAQLFSKGIAGTVETLSLIHIFKRPLIKITFPGALV